jgi:hypothetical protein
MFSQDHPTPLKDTTVRVLCALISLGTNTQKDVLIQKQREQDSMATWRPNCRSCITRKGCFTNDEKWCEEHKQCRFPHCCRQAPKPRPNCKHHTYYSLCDAPDYLWCEYHSTCRCEEPSCPNRGAPKTLGQGGEVSWKANNTAIDAPGERAYRHQKGSSKKEPCVIL